MGFNLVEEIYDCPGHILHKAIHLCIWKHATVVLKFLLNSALLEVWHAVPQGAEAQLAIVRSRVCPDPLGYTPGFKMLIMIVLNEIFLYTDEHYH